MNHKSRLKGSFGYYWSSSNKYDYDYHPAYTFYITTDFDEGIYYNIIDDSRADRSAGLSVRCFKNSPIVTYISDGEVIATQKSTEPAPTPSKAGYTLK